MNATLKSLLVIAAAAITLSACGLRGGLERPEPLWGDPDAEDLEPATDLPGETLDGAISQSDLEDEEDEAEDELLGGPDGE